MLQKQKNRSGWKKKSENLCQFIKKQYLCTAIQNEGYLFRMAEITLGYGVMVTQQILVLFFLVRVRVSQQKRETSVEASLFCMYFLAAYI